MSADVSLSSQREIRSLIFDDAFEFYEKMRYLVVAVFKQALYYVLIHFYYQIYTRNMSMFVMYGWQ